MGFDIVVPFLLQADADFSGVGASAGAGEFERAFERGDL
jgi:hypothetical protein